MLDLDIAEELGFDPIELLFRRGRTWLDVGDSARALAALNQYLAVYPDWGPALVARARVPGREPREAAADLARAARESEAPSPDLYVERALLLERAIRHMEQELVEKTEQ